MFAKRLTGTFRRGRADYEPPCPSSPRNIGRDGSKLKHFIIGLLVIGIVLFFAAIAYAGGGGGGEHGDASLKITPPEDRGYLAFPMRIMNRSTYDAYHLDPESDESAIISYSVSKTGWVRVRLVRRDNKNVVLRTIQQWTESHYDNKRQYQIEWDGKDATGNRIDPRQIFILFEARDSRYGGIHETHSTQSCIDPELIVSTRVETASTYAEPVLVATLADTGDRRGLAPEHHARVYLDEQLIDTLQFPAGTRTFTFNFKLVVFSRPDHTITVNLDDSQDHIGVARIHLRRSLHEPLGFIREAQK